VERLHLKPLAERPPVATRVDRTLAQIDRRVDWLVCLSPLHHEAMYEAFVGSGWRRVPEFRYCALSFDPVREREALRALPLDEVECPRAHAILHAKQRELELQIELVRLRGREGILAASIELFGHADAELLRTAEAVLEVVPVQGRAPADAGVEEVVEAANDEVERYRRRAPSFDARVVVDPDLGSKLMVSGDELWVAERIGLSRARVAPLLHHEIGTHLLTRHNGLRQPLQQFACGLAHYDTLQEGLAALSEFLSGYLSAARLRTIAVRVVATHRMEQGAGAAEIFRELVDAHRMAANEAFDVAIRVCRGGGLTKDVVYLRGLCELLAHLERGRSFERLFLGKLSFPQLDLVESMLDDGQLEPPELLPLYLDDPSARERLAACRHLAVADLYQETPP
jgi:uncharacterized protein (TIGR02421 family)